jgi:hypothetical protein
MPGSTAWVTDKRPAMLVSTMVCQSSSDVFCAGSRPSARPALSTSRSARRPVATILAPSWANRRAMAVPKPAVAPVTKTIMKRSGKTGDQAGA